VSGDDVAAALDETIERLRVLVVEAGDVGQDDEAIIPQHLWQVRLLHGVERQVSVHQRLIAAAVVREVAEVRIGLSVPSSGALRVDDGDLRRRLQAAYRCACCCKNR